MIVTRPANACFRRDTAARRGRFAPCVPHPARLTRSMSHAIAQCTRVAARRTVHASRAPRPSYPAPCQRSRESAANAKLPCRPFCDTEQRPPPLDRHALRHPQVRYPQYTNQNFDCPRSSQFREGFTNSLRFRPHHPVRPLQKACRPNAAKTFLPSIPYVHARPVHEKASFLATEPRSGTN